MRVDPRAGVAVAALAGLGAGQAGWWTATTTGLTGTLSTVEVSGTSGTGGLASALPAVALAAVLATLMLGRVGLRVMAVSMAAAGIGMAVVGFGSPAPVAEAVADASQLGISALTDPVATVWPILFGAAGVLLALASTWLLLRPPQRRPARSRSAADVTDPLAAWKAMDAGVDPTTKDADGDAHPLRREGELA